MTTITVSPVTRIEGHARIAVQSDAGRVTGATLQVYSFRGFEKFLQGVAMERLPALTSRVCGICPVAHQLASVKALEAALGVIIPPAAARLRELLLLGQYLASHPVSLGVLSLPDLLLPDAGADDRNVAGLVKVNPALAQGVLDLRHLGAAFFQTIGRREIHIGSCVIGGMSMPLTEADRLDLLARLHAVEPAVRLVMSTVRARLESGADRNLLACIPSPSMGLSAGGALAFYDGQVAAVDETGRRLALFDTARYFDYVSEQVLDDSTMKAPVLKDGRWFRVGPLARLNVNERITTPWAQRELVAYRQACGYPAHATLLFHYARAIELVYAWERAVELLSDPAIADPEVWVPVEPRAATGIGLIEAPRGMLVHHYTLNADGYATSVELVVATQHNNHAINNTLAALAPSVVGDPAGEAALNRLEMVVRAYDPCLSCATH